MASSKARRASPRRPGALPRTTLSALAAGVVMTGALSLATWAPARAQPALHLPAGTGTGAALTDAEAYLAQLRALARQSGSWRPERAPRAATVGIIGGFGLPHGTGFAGGALTNRRERTMRDADASGAVGFGFGDPVNALGVDVVIGLVSTQPPWARRGDNSVFGEDGNINIRVFRQIGPLFPGSVTSVAVGAGNLISWGDPRATPTNYFIASTTIANLTVGERRFPTNLTFGYGTAVRNQERDPGVFAGVGVGLNAWLSVGASWAGDEWIAGINLFPRVSETVDVQIGLQYADVTRRVSRGRVNLTVSLVARDLY
ncbi:MAG: hypothetical protein JJU19_13200 [Pararhodobacter sp.]|nr:hypothetical protein [Pararhodobacter sp.]